MFAVKFSTSHSIHSNPYTFQTIRFANRNESQEPSRSQSEPSSDLVELSPEAQSKQTIQQTIPIQTQNNKHSIFASITQIQNISSQTSKGILDLQALGFGETDILLERNSDGSLTSKKPAEFDTIQLGEQTLQIKASIQDNQVSFGFETDDNSTLANSLNTIFSLDAQTGKLALQLAKQSANESQSYLDHFSAGLETVLSHSNETLETVNQYLHVVQSNSSRSEDILSRLESSDPADIPQFISAAYHSGSELQNFLYTLDSYNQQTGENFLDTTEYAGEDLEELITQFNRISAEHVELSYQILPALEEHTSDFIHQLKRTDNSLIGDFLGTFEKAENDAGFLASQYSRIDNSRFNEYISLAVESDDRVVQLAEQTARFEPEQLDSFLDFASSTAQHNNLSLFLDQTARVNTSDLDQYVKVGNSSKDHQTDFLNGLKKVEDEDIHRYIAVSDIAGNRLPEFLDQLNRVKQNDIKRLLHVFHSADKAGFAPLMHYLQTANDVPLSNQLETLSKLGDELHGFLNKRYTTNNP